MGERGARNLTMFDGGYKFWYFLGYLGSNNHEKNIPGFMEPSPEIVPCYRFQSSSFQESVS